MEIYKNLIKEIGHTLKETGFAKKGNDFYRVLDKNFGIISFQKSRDSSNDLLVFTINFGVYSHVLGKTLNGSGDLSKPEVELCQWQARIGSFMPDSPDFWWKVSTADNYETVFSDVMRAIQNIIIPEMDKRIADDGLINSWLKDNYSGTTEINRFRYLTTLLKAKGEIEILREVVDSFLHQSKGRPNANRAVEHLREIGFDI